MSGTTRRTSGEDWTEWCPRGVLERVQAASHGRKMKRNNGSSLSVRKGLRPYPSSKTAAGGLATSTTEGIPYAFHVVVQVHSQCDILARTV
jgi:hypothetical protein